MKKKRILSIIILIIITITASYTIYYFKDIKASFQKEFLTQSVSFYQKLAKRGDPLAQRLLGSFYLTGIEEIGLVKDQKIAFELFEEASKKGDVESFWYLGTMYTLGQGVDRDLEKGEYFYNLYSKSKKEILKK